MALGIYAFPHPEYLITPNYSISITFNGRLGGRQDRRLYIRNNNSGVYFSDITVQALSEGVVDYTNGTVDGWYTKLARKETQLYNEEWEQINAGNILSIPSIGTSLQPDTSTYISFWITLCTPNYLPVQTVKDIYLHIEAKENLINA